MSLILETINMKSYFFHTYTYVDTIVYHMRDRNENLTVYVQFHYIKLMVGAKSFNILRHSVERKQT